MEFQLYERKFRFVDDVLYSYYKYGTSKSEKWRLVKLSLSSLGYKQFVFNVKGKSKHFYYHRVMYYANNPQWDIYDSSKDNVIDHIDQIKTNNHISNLRNVTQQENRFNTKAKGYYFFRGMYHAQITLNRKQIHIGCYNTPEEAREAYLNKKDKLHKIQQK